MAFVFRFLCVVGLLLGVTVARADADGRMTRGAAAARPASGVSLASALHDAHRLAALKGDTVVRVEGGSMLPYFGDGSVLVVKATAVDALREGAVVLYRNRFDEIVAHRLEAKSAEGWTVRGANNTESDSTLVTAGNLVGAVYATFYSDPGTVAEALDISPALMRDTVVALAAPAR